MNWLRYIAFRLEPFFRRQKIESELSAELRSHLEMATEAHLAAGLSPEDAERAARRELGGLEPVKEYWRDERGFPWIEHLGRDTRQAFRRLGKTPGFAAVAMLTLALGIGATTALFSVVEEVLLRPLDYPQPDRLLTLWSLDLKHGGFYRASGADFRDWRAQSRSFSGLAKYWNDSTVVVLGREAEALPVASVSGDFFAVLGVTPTAGRLFSAEEGRTGGAVVIGSSFAQRHFGGDVSRAIGADLKLYSRLFRVVGVLPAGFDFPEKAEIWLPVDTISPEAPSRSAHNYRVIGRLAAGVTPSAARAELDGIAAQLARQYPDSNSDEGIEVIPLLDFLVRNHRSTLWLMLGVVGLLLLIACANVANLLLARGAGRTRELAVRIALGATRGQLIGTMLAESVVLALGAGLAGLLLAWAGLRIFVALAPPGIPRLDRAGLDGAALLASTLATFATCFLAGLWPALKSTRMDLLQMLRSGGRGIAVSAGGIRNALAVVQLALSLVLLSAAGLLLHSFERLLATDPGYRAADVLVMETSYPVVDAVEGARAVAFFEDFAREAAATPGVRRVAYAQNLPVDTLGANGNYEIEGRPVAMPYDSSKQNALWRCVSAGYFGTLGIPLRAGREFDQRDTPAGQPVVVINQSMARASWPGQDPLGHRIRIGWESADAEWMTVVGVVADAKQGTLDRPGGEELYVCAPQHPALAGDLKVIAQTLAAPLALTETFRQIVRRLNSEVPLKFTTAETLVADTLAAPRFRVMLLGQFAGVAFLLALIGVAAVMACLVAERRAEIGVRMALGALPSQILRHFLLRAFRLAALGLALGLVASLLVGQAMTGLLYDVPPNDPVVLAAVSLLLLAAAVVAAFVPALRASRVDPLTTIRAD
jgi:predicted permease